MRQIKKLLIILFAINIITVNAFAVAVSDNDGSAFITKSEFDSLKSKFQSQIDSYNSSIDSKIDAAIASYLAGIKVSSREEAKNLISAIEESWGKKIYWYGGTTVGTDYIVNISRFCVRTVLGLATQDAVALWTKGYCDTLEHYNNGYPVLKIEDNKITSCVTYKPLLTYTISYFREDRAGTSFGANLSSWSSMTHFGSTQDDRETKYWVGYFNNKSEFSYSDANSEAWRTVNLVFSPTEKMKDFVLAPLATTKCSVWDPNNKESTTTAGGSSAPTAVYDSGKQGGTNSSTGLLTDTAQPLNSPDFTASLPWVTVDNTYNDLVLNLNGESVAPAKMKYGLPVSKATKKGTLKWKINVKPGKFGWYKNTNTEYANIPAKQKMDITEAKEISGSIDVEKDDKVFFIYLPNDLDQIDISELYYEYESQ